MVEKNEGDSFRVMDKDLKIRMDIVYSRKFNSLTGHSANVLIPDVIPRLQNCVEFIKQLRK